MQCVIPRAFATALRRLSRLSRVARVAREQSARDVEGKFRIRYSNKAPDLRSGASLIRRSLHMARDGIEPPTRGFSVRCSTN
jgi:hypothetical protein